MNAPLHRDPFAPERYELDEPPRYAFDLDRRGFLEALGGGIAVLLVLPVAADAGGAVPAPGQQDGDGGIGAFLHVDQRGVRSRSTPARPRWVRTSAPR